MMEESSSSTVLDGRITGIRFGLATRQEICTASNSDCPVSHASQLSNPFLGLPLEAGKCESCGTAEPGQCEGHFGYIELPVAIYHPSHVGELKRMLSLLCLKCLKLKNRKLSTKNVGVIERALTSCCEEASQVSINEVKTTDGASYLELKLPSKSRHLEGAWDFLERYGFRYGDNYCRPLLPSEVMAMLKKIPAETKKKLAGKGYFSQEGYVMQYLPVPPNCLSVPDVSDGISSMSSDVSLPMLKKVLRQVEVIKSSRSGTPNFESLEVEVNDLQAAVSQYLQARGTKASREGNTRFGFSKELNDSSSTKAWLEKMKTLFISKGSGFSSRSVITGDPFKGVGDIGIPSEIAQRITFEERVNEHNMTYLQKLVDEKLCLTYRDGSSTYSLREGSKGHTFLRPGQVVHRRIMEGDMIFINRPPTTHKHSLQALSVYVHDDHTFKINPLICGPLSADFDGDCIHIFYPQSPEAKAEVLELFAVEKQLLSSHSGNINLQLTSDSLLSLKNMFRSYFYRRSAAQQLSMFCSNSLPKPSLLKAHKTYPLWTAVELLEASLPRGFDCSGERYLIRDSRILKLDFNRDAMQSIINDVVTSIFFNKGPSEVLRFFNSIQPMLMENLSSEGCSLSLEDFIAQKDVLGSIQMDIQDLSPLLHHLRSNYNELIELQLEKHMWIIKVPVANFILKSSSMGNLIDSKSEAGINRIVQQVGFMGLQISDRGKLYSKTLVGDLASLFRTNYPFPAKYPSEEFGLIRTGLFHGLDPYQELVHSISSREVMVRSSRGLTEPGTLFKNLMAILRDVVICYDGTVRNVCSNSIIQFEYGAKTQSLFGAGEPVGVLAATAMSNPAYKAVLDSSPSSNSSWEMMKEILLCRVNFKNDALDRRVVLYLTDCDCGREYCLENAAYMVKNHLKKVSLKDVAAEFLIEYKGGQVTYESSETGAGLVGHIHLNKMLLKDSNISMEEVLEKCENTINLFRKKKKVGNIFKRIGLSFSECSFHQTSENKSCPCLKFFWHEQNDIQLERISHIFADTICPVLLETIIKGDPRVREANILWVSPETTTWIRNPSKNQKGELAVDVVLEKEAVKKTGDAWRTVLDSCLPVIHLIDTRRSIPYAIKQVQDLLGISCAFEQAVQRLSTSVSMVTKGVLKDHLVLLANSMTCAGNLVGFNTGGIKALSRTLNVQVPFTEATLFTPKKCFERAAEKCHADSLSSIVASCSWGKHVAVGTGSRFDVLWDTREVELNQKDGIDVYDFLHFVRSGPGGEETDSVCLGGEVDSFDMEADNMGMSPEHNDGVDKPVFEDAAEFDFDLEKQNVDSQTTESIWDKVPSSNVESGGGWERVIEKPASGGWSKEDHSSSSGWGGTESAKGNNQAGAWGKKVTEVDQSDQTSGWAAAASKKDLGQSGSWGKKDVEVDGTGWNKGSQTPVDQSDQTGGWAAASKKDFGQSGSRESSWGNKVKEADNNGWNSKTDNDGWAAAKKQSGGDSTTKTQGSSWGASGLKKDSDQLNTSASWGGNKVKEADGSGWNSKTDNDKGTDTGKQNAWSSAAGTQSSTWGQKKDSGSQDWASIGSKKDSEQLNASGSWGNKVKEADKSGWGRKNDNEDGDPVRKQNVVDGTAGSESGGWGHKEASGSLDWGAIASKKDSDQSSSLASWGRKDEKVNEPEGDSAPKNDEGWGAKKKEDSSNSSNWGNHDKGQDKSGSWGWGGKKVEEKTEETGWKKKDGWGSSKDGDWKNKRDRPARPVGGSNDGPRTPVPYTATRQRLDSFTAEEQDVLSDIEPIMQSIRRIMHQTGYNDGDPLSADDQTYILDNVFKYHPDKAQKMGSGIEYVMVNKHSNFQESRCLYIVSTDGRKEDFSYRKCLENFIREKYPDKVEDFMAKYFKKPQPRPVWNKDNNRGGSGGGPDDSKKPWGGWNNNRPSEGGTPRSGWGNKATEEGGTPQSGWGNKATEEGGTPPQSSWGNKATEEGGTPRQSSWGNKATEGGAPSQSGWVSGSKPVTEGVTPPQSGWGNKATEGGNPSQSGWGSGSKPVTEGGTPPQSGWGSGSKPVTEGGTPPQSGWGSGSKTPTEGGGTPRSGWGSPGSTQATEEGGTPKSGWGSGSKTTATEEGGTPRSGWGS